MRQALIATLNDGNVSAWVAAFTTDSVQMPPHSPANLGRESIRTWSLAFYAHFRTAFALKIDEVQVAGDWAFERGTYTITLTPKARGELLQVIGKYITIYEQEPSGAQGMGRNI